MRDSTGDMERETVNNLKDQIGVGRNDAARPSIPIAEVRGDFENSLLSETHLHDAHIPPLNHLQVMTSCVMPCVMPCSGSLAVSRVSRRLT